MHGRENEEAMFFIIIILAAKITKNLVAVANKSKACTVNGKRNY